jgi:NTE family protein
MGGRGTVVPQLESLTTTADADVLGADHNGAENLLVRNGRAMKKLLQRQIFGRADNGPGISTVMMDAFNIVQDRIARSRLAGDPPDVIITPRLSLFGLFDFHRADELIRHGNDAADREIEDIVRDIATRRQIVRPEMRSA